MKRFFRYILLLLILSFCIGTMAQVSKWRDMHKVKKHETLFSISNQYGITIEELIDANPDMKIPGYELKKGEYVCIPYTKDQLEAIKNGTYNKNNSIKVKSEAKNIKSLISNDIKKRAIKVGVMLPLHENDGDGRRMIEYYRGLLMACDSLKKEGISVDIHTWNIKADDDIRLVFTDASLSKCDIIFGPLYSNQVKPLTDYASKYNIRIVIPFSISTDELFTNRNIYQVYQTPNDLNGEYISKFIERFSKYHPVFIDCNDVSSKKGLFTFGLRRELESRGIGYSLTNLKSSEEVFAKSFSRKKPNVVILNTGRSPELNVAFAKLNSLVVNIPGLMISMFGYTEWLMYTEYDLDNFYRFDTYIPSTFYYDPLSARTKRIEKKYRWNFHSDMQASLPRFAITGFDQTYYFLKGLHVYGNNFVGNTGTSGYLPIQTPLHFSRIGAGGLQNKSFMFIHYNYKHNIELINY